ncbi:conserved hypothetical protein [Actinomyces sp. oral taxon 180 str. F0310]|nr:conserved hypothetical protein [Actinomyces sp. oral taxon 180 str. F0310]
MPAISPGTRRTGRTTLPDLTTSLDGPPTSAAGHMILLAPPTSPGTPPTRAAGHTTAASVVPAPRIQATARTVCPARPSPPRRLTRPPLAMPAPADTQPPPTLHPARLTALTTTRS